MQGAIGRCDCRIQLGAVKHAMRSFVENCISLGGIGSGVMSSQGLVRGVSTASPILALRVQMRCGTCGVNATGAMKRWTTAICTGNCNFQSHLAIATRNWNSQLESSMAVGGRLRLSTAKRALCSERIKGTTKGSGLPRCRSWSGTS